MPEPQPTAKGTYFYFTEPQSKNTEFKIMLGMQTDSGYKPCKIMDSSKGKSLITYTLNAYETVYKWVEEDQILIIE